MKAPEYDNFFYMGNVIELVDALDGGQQDLLPQYDRSRLFCPECMRARLTFTRRTSLRRAFLSTKRPAENEDNAHDPGCSHAYKRASKKQTTEYYQELTADQVTDKLEAAINRFLRRNQNPGRNVNAAPQGENPAIATILENGRETRRRLPTRSIYSIYGIPDEELDIPVLLYGEVKLSVTKNPSDYGEYFLLNVRNKRTGKRIRFFKRGRMEDEIDQKALYYLAVVVLVHRNSDGKLESEIYNKNNKFLRYVKINTPDCR